MEAMICIMRYLKSAPEKCLMFSKNNHLDVRDCTNAGWAHRVTDRKSTSDYFTFIGDNLVTWKSTKQKIIVRSNAKVEYKDMVYGVCELILLRNLLRGLGFKPKQAMDLNCDDKAMMDIAHNLVQHERTNMLRSTNILLKRSLMVNLSIFFLFNTKNI